MIFNKNQWELVKLAGPIITGQLTQMIISVTDAIMVGQLGHIELASSSLMISIISIPSFTLVGICFLISSLTATRRGENRPHECSDVLYNGGLSVVVLSILISILLTVLFPMVYYFGQEDEVIAKGENFFLWLVWSNIPMIIFLCIKNFYDGLELTRVPMILSTFAVILNIFLNLVFIYGYFGLPAYGLEGSGIASFLTRIIICILLIAHLLQNKTLLSYGMNHILIKRTEIKSFLNLALPSSWQYTSEVAAFAVLAIISGWYGSEQQASHQIAITVAAFTYVIFVGFSTAASIKIGEAFGRKNMNDILQIGKDAVKISLMIASITLCFLFFGRNLIASVFNANPEVLRITSILLIFAAIFQYSDSLQALGVGMLRGIQDIRIPTLYTTIAYWVFGLPVGYFLAEYFQWKVFGIWTGFILCLTVSAGLLHYRFFKLARQR